MALIKHDMTGIWDYGFLWRNWLSEPTNAPAFYDSFNVDDTGSFPLKENSTFTLSFNGSNPNCTIYPFSKTVDYTTSLTYIDYKTNFDFVGFVSSTGTSYIKLIKVGDWYFALLSGGSAQTTYIYATSFSNDLGDVYKYTDVTSAINGLIEDRKGLSATFAPDYSAQSIIIFGRKTPLYTVVSNANDPTLPLYQNILIGGKKLFVIDNNIAIEVIDN